MILFGPFWDHVNVTETPMSNKPFKVLLPIDVMDAIEDAASKSLRSKTSEIVFALRNYYASQEVRK
jgi:hypothetical protein